MHLSIERIREESSDKLLFKEGDSINMHFKLPDGEVVSFEDVPFDLLMTNVQAYRKNRVNGYDHNLFIEEGDDFDDLEELTS